MKRSLTVPGMLLLVWPTVVGQIPTDDPVEAQMKWYVREQERPNLVKGAFEVLRFPTGYEFKPRYRHPENQRKLIENPDFYCNRCLREKRFPKGTNVPTSFRLMDRDGPYVLDQISQITRDQDWIFIENDSFQLFFDAGGMSLREFFNPFLKEEIAELSDVLTEVSDKTVELNEHQRAHLYLIRSHRLLRDFFWLAGTTNEGVKTKYPWLGPYMGMNGKQQLYVFEKQSHYDAFSTKFIGRTSAAGQTWHNFTDCAMAMLMHGQGYSDPQLQNFFLHRTAHNFLDAYRKYAFKLPAWFQMGLGAWVERRETPRFNTFCFSEGTIPKLLFDDNWLPKIKKMVLSDKVEAFAACCVRQEYGEFPPEYNMIAYSWFCYLLRLGPEKFPTFVNVLKSKDKTESLYQIQVKAFKEAYNLTILQFETGWREWVRQVYPDL